MITSERIVLKGYYWNHDAIRKDVVRLEAILTKVDFYNANGFLHANQWFQFHSKSLLFHHHGEDEFFFPEIKNRFPDVKDKIELMDQQHQELDRWMFEVGQSLQRLAVDDSNAEEKTVLKNALKNYIAVAVNHLNAEEPIVEEAISRVPVPEVLALEQKFMKEMPMEIKTHTMPWLLDAMDEKDRKYFMGMVPFIAKLLYRFKLKPNYNSLTGNI